MEQRRLGTSDLQVSLFALGAMTFGMRGPPAIARVDQASADRLVGQAIDEGITLFDTADVYNSGESEELLGNSLGARRNDIVLSTKVGLRTDRGADQTGLCATHIARSAEASLKRLGTDHIDLYIAHRIDPSTPLEETLVAFDALICAGKVRHVGISNWPAWVAAKAIAMQRANGWSPFVTNQVYYSLVDRDVENELVPCALSEGFGLMIWSPLAMGRLTGKYQCDARQSGRLTRYQTFAMPDADRLERVLVALREIAETRGASPAQIALAWLASRPAVTAILLGVTHVDQLTAC